MNTRSDVTLPLVPGYCYHIYNRANSDHNLFFTTDNFAYFLQQYARYLDPYLETFAYCLLPNHFYLLVRIRSTETIFKAIKQDYEQPPRNMSRSISSLCSTTNQLSFSTDAFKDFRFLQKLPIDIAAQTAALFVSNQFRKLFMSYSKAINKQMQRRGALFHRPFKRKVVSKHLYLKWLIWYIHRNPLHHGLQEDFRSYPWSSYRSLLSDRITRLSRAEVLSWFEGSSVGFEAYHDLGAQAWGKLSKLALE